MLKYLPIFCHMLQRHCPHFTHRKYGSARQVDNDIIRRLFPCPGNATLVRLLHIALFPILLDFINLSPFKFLQGKATTEGTALPLASSGYEQFVKHLTPLRPGSSPLAASGLHIKANLILLEVATYPFAWTTHISEQPLNGFRCRKCLKSVRNEHEDGNQMRGERRQRKTQDLTA